MRFPCKNCTNRFLGCHTTCEEYIEADKKNRELLEKRREIRNKEDVYLNGRRLK